MLDGESVRETLKLGGVPLKPTAANIKHAHRLAAEIRRQIARGTFDYAEHFPDSPRTPETAPKAFGTLADLWLESRGQLEDASHDQYANAVAMWKRLLGEHTRIDALTHQVLAAKIGGHPWASPKSLNNYLIPLRGVFAFEFHGQRAALNPMNGIKNLKVVRKLPDPLTGAERDRILADLNTRYDVRVWAYFAFAFYTGMRPEEIIALRWGDIDTAGGVIRVQRVRTFRGTEREGSKTHTERDVDLMDVALEVLEVMRPYTFMKGVDADIFENPVVGRPWHDERSQRDHYWTPALKRLGIRRRRPYCTRHTYATVALMGRVNPAYIATQLGNSLKMLLERYARWIPGADGGSEKELMRGVMQNTSPELPRRRDHATNHRISKEEAGRRDWTRTNEKGKSGGK